MMRLAMKKIIGVIIVVVVIACAAVFFVQKKVEDNTREYIALIPEPYKVTVEDVSYSLFSNTLTLSKTHIEADINLSTFRHATPGVMSLTGGVVSFSGDVEKIEVSGFDAFAGEETLDKPGIELAKRCVLEKYNFVLKSGKMGEMKASIEECEYKDMALRPDATLNQLLASTDTVGMMRAGSMVMRGMSASMDTGMTVSLESAEARDLKDGKVAETVMKNYKAEAYGQVLFNCGGLTLANLNYSGMLKPGLENPPLTGVVVSDMTFSPLLGAQTVKSIGALEAKMEGDAVKAFTFEVRDLELSRNMADNLFGDFTGMKYPDYLRTHGGVRVSVDPKGMFMLINELDFGFQDGFDAKLELGDCRLPLEPFAKNFEGAAESLGSLLTLRKGVLTVADHSFLERFKKTLTPDDVQAVRAFFASDAAPRKILDGLAAQFENPGTLTISMDAPAPVSLDKLRDVFLANMADESWFSVIQKAPQAAGE